MLWRVMRAERLKLKRTFALKMAVLAPVVVTLLLLFITSQAPFSMLRRGNSGNEWTALARVTFFFWGLLMLPLYITIQATLVAGVDHAENQWKALLARPVPRWTYYVAKLVLVMALVLFGTLVLVAGIVGTGVILPHLQTEVKFASPVPAAIFREAAQITGLMFLALTIQHWVSMRYRSFAVAGGFGVVAMVTGYAMVPASQPIGGPTQYFPWALPMMVLATWHPNVDAALWASAAGGCLVTVLGCLEFSRRDLQ